MEDRLCIGAMVLLGLAWFVVMAVLVTFANRAIGRSYDAKAAELRARIEASLVREARGVRMRTLATSWFALSYRWGRADVWLTPRAIYLAQSVMLFGKPMGQPVIGIAFEDTRDLPNVVSFRLRLRGAPRVDRRGRLRLVAASDRRFLGFTLRFRLELPDAQSWMNDLPR